MNVPCNAIVAPAGSILRPADEKEDTVLKCRDLAEMVTPYLDGGLPPRARFGAWLHLRICSACRRYVDQMRRTIRLLGSGPVPPPPENESEIIALLETTRHDR